MDEGQSQQVVEVAESKVEILARRVEERGRELALSSSGLKRSLLYETIVEGLRAETVIYNGKGEEINRLPDHGVRAKFVQAAIEVLGEKAEKGGGMKVAQMVVVLPDGRRV